MSSLPKRYNALETEQKQQEFWLKNQIYKWQDDLPKEQTFVIDTPPPTVSGLLHMGHVFSYVQADFIARYKRMKGFDVFYPMGFDDNGLPTERLVEKVIGKKASQMSREEFTKECYKIIEPAEQEFEEFFNSIALSVDWNQKYQTISKESQQISQASFIDLFNKDLVERRFAPVLWDIVDRTALSQADLIDKEKSSVMHDIIFGVEDASQIIIATTRPELLPSCVAVMVHPDDERYRNLHGKFAITPLFGVKVKIIPDDLVQIDKGTGAVMCCTFGDETDIKWWQKHDLPLRVLLKKDGTFSGTRILIEELSNQKNDDNFASEEFCSFYQKLEDKKVKEAREIIVEILKSHGSNNSPLEGGMISSHVIKNQPLLIKSTPITHNVKCAERSGAPVEILAQSQWFIKILDHKNQLQQKVKECNWHPEFMRLRAEQWIENLAWDWCISRQRYFGVTFPVWHLDGKIFVANLDKLKNSKNTCNPLEENSWKEFLSDKDLELIKNNYGENPDIIGEIDIMDTWATSSLSPQLSSKGISSEFCLNKKRHEKLFPANLRPQAHEIIRSWAFYTIVKSYLHEEQKPWDNLMISGWCLAADKTKMSKSKGNVVTPQKLISEKGTDAVRYWASTSNLGTDTSYSEELFKIGSKLVTKIFNASKFVSLNFADLKQTPTNPKTDIENQIITKQSDLWILSRLKQTISKTEIEFDKFEYGKARQIIEDFFWNDFCDNYLEIIKVRSYGLNAQKYDNITLSDYQKEQLIAGQKSCITTLYHCLENILKLFAPFIPHVVEEIYQAIFVGKLSSIHERGSWCKLEEQIFDEDSIAIGEIIKEVIFNIRKFKSDNNLSMKTPLQEFSINSKIDLSLVISDLENVCNTDTIRVKDHLDKNIVFDIK